MQYGRQCLCWSGSCRNRQDTVRAFRQGLAETAEHDHQPERNLRLHQHPDGQPYPGEQDFHPHTGYVRRGGSRQFRRAYRAEDFPCRDCRGQRAGQAGDRPLREDSADHRLHRQGRQRHHAAADRRQLLPHQERGQADCRRRNRAHQG